MCGYYLAVWSPLPSVSHGGWWSGLALFLKKIFSVTFGQFAKTFLPCLFWPTGFVVLIFAMQRVSFVPRRVSLHEKFCDVILALYARSKGVFGVHMRGGPILFCL